MAGKNILPESLNQFNGAKLTLDSDVDQDTFGKVTKHKTHDSQGFMINGSRQEDFSCFPIYAFPIYVNSLHVAISSPGAYFEQT